MILIRLITLCILLCSSAIVLAQPLYKWVESDGSITFSVKPPQDGIEYETINARSSENTQQPPANTTREATRAVDTTRTPETSERQAIVPKTTPDEPAQRIAPLPGEQAGIRSGIRDSTQSAPVSAPAQAAAEVVGSASAVQQSKSDQTAALHAKGRKQQQCEDLKKRVVSLERRLKTRLTPEDMDNTVVHMARYQRSYDVHCVQ